MTLTKPLLTGESVQCANFENRVKLCVLPSDISRVRIHPLTLGLYETNEKRKQKLTELKPQVKIRKKE